MNRGPKLLIVQLDGMAARRPERTRKARDTIIA
jgi:hypothetical protein